MSTTEEIIKAHTKSQKENILSKLTDKQKEELVLEFERKILTAWDSCGVETNKKILKSFKSLDEQILYFDSLLSFANWTYKKYTYPNRTQKTIFQWDIFYCDLGHNIGSEKNKTRPVVIVQKTKGYLDAGTLLVAPITIGENFDKLYKHEILIDKTYYGKIKGKIDLSHIRAVDRSRLDAKFEDRLLKREEYEEHYGKDYIPIQIKIQKALKQLFAIDI
jgi:mRNA-degrading endonuclease toxin of MazEF toxin-antitoxin module